MGWASHGEDWREVSMEDFKELLKMVDQERVAYCDGLVYYLKRGKPGWNHQDHFATFYDNPHDSETVEKGLLGRVFVHPRMFKKEEQC